MKPDTVEVLLQPHRPFLHLAPETDAPSMSAFLDGRFQRTMAIELDGTQMRTEQQTFSAYANAFHGGRSLRNWDAFIDIMRSIEELELDYDQCITFIRNADACMRDERNGLATLGSSLGLLGEHWTKPVKNGEWWDHGPKAFHTVFLFHRLPPTLPDASPIDLWAGS